MRSGAGNNPDRHAFSSAFHGKMGDCHYFPGVIKIGTRSTFFHPWKIVIIPYLLFDGDGFGKVAGLVNIGSPDSSDVIGEQLEWDRR